MLFSPGSKIYIQGRVGCDFFPKGEKEPLYSLQSGSKVAHYIEVVQNSYLRYKTGSNVFMDELVNYRSSPIGRDL
jgi:hypothetical protein